jgi:SAM-dependent methyltransferase
MVAMRTEVDALKGFYASPMGEVAARQISRRAADLWPNLTGQTVIGIGYPTPVLEPIAAAAGAERVAAFMPGPQGAWRWPSDAQSLTGLIAEDELPLADRSVDRVLLLHTLEEAEALRPLLREIWRVLTDSGRILAITTSRRGLWCRTDATPFGHGRPYTMRQLRRVLQQAMFAPEAEARALYALPSARALSLWSSDAAERFGQRWAPRFGGVVMIDAAKSLYGAAPAGGAKVRSSAVVAESGGLNRSNPSSLPRVPAAARGEGEDKH